MWTDNAPHLLVDVLAAIFATAGMIDMAGSLDIRGRLRPWRYPRQLYRVMGVLQLFTAVFLVVPQLRIWGIILSGFMTTFWIVIFLNRRQWRWAVAGMLIMTALVPASLAIH
jgi:hypothetical protein